MVYVCHKGLLTVCEQEQDGTPDDGQRNCPKHVEFYSKNKFEKLVHLVGYIIRIYHDARSPERQITGAWTRLYYEELYNLYASLRSSIMSTTETAHEKCIQNFET